LRFTKLRNHEESFWRVVEDFCSLFNLVWFQKPERVWCRSKTWMGLVKLIWNGLVANVFDSSFDLSSYVSDRNTLYLVVSRYHVYLNCCWLSVSILVIVFTLLMLKITCMLAALSKEMLALDWIPCWWLIHLQVLNPNCSLHVFTLDIVCNLVSCSYEMCKLLLWYIRACHISALDCTWISLMSSTSVSFFYLI